jgi:ubiquinone/menaquinone biosynthesis C-methylase UbiE
VAAWYDKLVGETGSDYHREVIVPAALRLLEPAPGESVVDVCCGQGVLVRPLLESGIGRFTGVDASARLIAAAKSRHGNDPRVAWVTADVCQPGAWADGTHDAAACLMAVHDVRDAAAMFGNVARALKPGGRAVLVMMHPCFRIPRQTHWGWDADQKIQYRRIDAYRTALAIPITTHPGKDSGEHTVFHHRSLAELLTALGNAGLAVLACEELYSHRRSQASGPFSKAEHRAAEEFPVFLALKAVRARPAGLRTWLRFLKPMIDAAAPIIGLIDSGAGRSERRWRSSQDGCAEIGHQGFRDADGAIGLLALF